MKKYRIIEYYDFSYKYEVQANDKDEALELHRNEKSEHIPELDSTDYFDIEVEEI